MRGRSTPRNLLLAGAAAILIALPAGAGSNDDAATHHPGGPHHPPKTGQWVGDHWTPYNPPVPESFSEGSEVYRIQRDDTLWDLAGRFFSDPYLWPQIWDANRYILDSHWIYPGDPLLIPDRPTVISEVLPQVDQPTPAAVPDSPGPPSTDPGPPPPDTAPVTLKSPTPRFGAGATAPPAAGTAAAVAAAPTPRARAFADTTDLECLGFIVDKYRKSNLFIAASEEPAKTGFATDDIVYLNGGEEDGVSPGDQFSVVRKQGTVRHPVSGKRLGDYIQNLGRLRVIAVQPRTSIAEIEFSCWRLERGLDLVPYDPVPSPFGLPPDFDYRAVAPTDMPKGHVVYASGLKRAAAGQMVQVDLGSSDGAEPGDFVTLFVDTADPEPPPYKYSYTYENQQYESLWRDVGKHRDFPRRIVGHAVVITVTEQLAVVKILNTIHEVEVGQRVELQ